MANKKKNSNVNNLKFIINAQYLKDLSFENPRAPDSLKNFSSNPTFKIDVDVKSKTLSDHGPNIYEVELLIKGETKVQDDSLFVIEGSYCGIFTIENADGDILEKILLIPICFKIFPISLILLLSLFAKSSIPLKIEIPGNRHDIANIKGNSS